MKLSSIFLLAFMALVVGCSSNPQSPSTNGSGSKNPDTTSSPQPTGTLGSFKFAINHDTLDELKYPNNCLADISYYNYGEDIVPGKHYLELNIMFSRTDFVQDEMFLNFTSPVSGPVPATYSITNYNDESGVIVSLDSMGTEYLSNAGGSFTITMFDTVHNLVSGTFRVVLAQSSPTPNPNDLDTITGSFSNVGFSMGAFGQGTFTAFADGKQFQPRYNGMYDLHASINPGSSNLVINGFEDDTTSSRTIILEINTPAVGTFTLESNLSPGAAIGSYESAQGMTYSSTGSSGTLVITKFDTVARRISGTFSFTCQTNGGQSDQVTNGVIDNIQWVAE